MNLPRLARDIALVGVALAVGVGAALLATAMWLVSQL